MSGSAFRALPSKALATPTRVRFWHDRNVFVTGGFGLLGTTLIEALHAMGARVFVLKRDHVPASRLFETVALDAVTIVHGDFEDYDTVY
ncbi:NmrA family NAD(P)-binding protein, partial [Candidatus Uhrbacteria bacterium]|nr:NmrA family NAD(P)-binding protein [Candidatus Uhrbacteria bacterium]